MSVRLLLSLGLALPLVLTLGCGDKLKPSDPGPGTDGGGGSTGDGGGSKDGGVATIDMTGFNQAGSPEITITAPAANMEIQVDLLTLTATITTPSSTLIAGDTVTITITPPGKSPQTAPMYLTSTPNVYSGQ